MLTAGDTAVPNDAGSNNRDTPALSADAPLAPDPTSPSVTVVIAAYNAEKFIRPTIESVLAQCVRDVELIVVDDGSTDGTAEILRTFPDRRLTVIRQENRGVSAARNTGLAAAHAPYIFFLDADDILLRDSLRRMILALDESPRHVACFAHHLRIAEDGAEISTRADLRWKLFPAEAARAVRGFSPALKLGEDWEFWCRLAALGDFIALPDHVALLYRQRFSSANYRLRSEPLRQNFEAIDAVYSNPAIQKKFTPAEFRRKRRRAEIDAFWAGARNEYLQARIFGFLKHLTIGALFYPDSILRPRLVFLFLRGLQRHIGRPAASRVNP
jgi:glycosyltransferase involved in cell wall biosynthesis